MQMYNFFQKIKAFPSTHVTAWRVIENKISSKVNLERRGVGVRATFVACAGCQRSQQVIFSSDV